MAASDRRSRAEHDPVTTRRDHGHGESQLCVAADANDTRERRARAVVDERSIGDRRDLVQRDVESVAERIGPRRYESVPAAELEARLGLDPVKVEDAQLARFLEAEGRLVRVGDGHAVAPSAYARARETLVAELETAGTITLARFRDLLGISRKPAQLLLERFDADGVTRRVGDERMLRRSPVRSSE